MGRLKTYMTLMMLLVLHACLPFNHVSRIDIEKLEGLFGSHIVFHQCSSSDFKYVADFLAKGTQNEEGVFVYYNSSEFRLFSQQSKSFIITDKFLNNNAYFINFKGRFRGWVLEDECGGRYYTNSFFLLDAEILESSFSIERGN